MKELAWFTGSENSLRTARDPIADRFNIVGKVCLNVVTGDVVRP